MAGYRTRWVDPPEQAENPERITVREALAFGKAVYDQRRALSLSVAELAGRSEPTVDEAERIAVTLAVVAGRGSRPACNTYPEQRFAW